MLALALEGKYTYIFQIGGLINENVNEKTSIPFIHWIRKNSRITKLILNAEIFS